MCSRYFQHAVVIATLLSFVVRAQKVNIIPEDLQGGFKSSGKEIQVSYSNEAVNGFKDGTSFEKDAVASEPTFALGDSSGISPTTLFTIVMIDTTCPNARKLHYARANFKNNFNIVNIETESAALLDYKAPGELGETGDNRQYTFLLYTNPARKQIDQLKLPAEGENFAVKQFQSDNGLQDASAGVGMVVKLGGGTADCRSEQPNDAPDNLSSSKPAQSSTAESSSVSAGPTAISTATSAAEQQSSSAAQTDDTNGPENTSSPSSTGEASGSDDSGSSVTSSKRTTNLSTASTVPPTDASGLSTITSTAALSRGPGGAGASGTPTASTSLVQQTTNAAPGASNAYSLAIAPLFAVAGVLLW